MSSPSSTAIAAAARTVARTGSIGFRAGSREVTYGVSGDAIEVVDGVSDAATLVVMSPTAWDDFVGQVRTFINLYLAGELTFERGGFEQLADWDPALKLMHAGIPIYEPRDLSAIDLDRAFTLDDDDDDLRAFLSATGYLHVRGVFTAEEMAAANAEVDRLAGLARPKDDESWWVTTATGEEVCCRLVYASRRSEVLAELESDPRLARLGTLCDPTLRIAPDRMEGFAVLCKVEGETKGLSNIPWHQDCGMGGHGILCPTVSVGVQFTGSSRESGNLLVVPGSHGQTLHYQWEKRLAQAPVIEIDTAPGDVTVHIGDVMHASPQPTGGGGRRTGYTTFYPPSLWQHIGPGEAYNDVIRNRTAKAAALQ